MSNVNNTIFDDVFRTMVQKMPELLIPLINEVFGTSYNENEPFRHLRNEHEEEFGKIITDSIIVIRNKTYHIECQSNDDNTMAIRMVQYDFAIALEQATKTGRVYEMDFPDSCVIYLRHTKETPNKLQVKVNFANGNSCMYDAKVIKVQEYTKDDIFKKKLLFFLPYYIMRYEKNVHEISSDPEKLKGLLIEYSEIRKNLEKDLCDTDKAVLYKNLIDLIIQISDYIFRSEYDAKKGLGEVMGGKILELYSERMERLDRETQEALEKGKAQGMAQGMA